MVGFCLPYSCCTRGYLHAISQYRYKIIKKSEYISIDYIVHNKLKLSRLYK